MKEEDSPDLFLGVFFVRTDITHFIMPGKLGSALLQDLVMLATHASEGIFDRKKMSYGYEAYRDHVRYTERRVHETMRRLEKSGHVSLVMEGENIKEIVLTTLGKKSFLEKKLIDEQKHLLGNRYCQVSFDIPESERKLRRNIRILLKKIGFSRAQRSVWVSKKSVHRLLAAYFRSYYPSLSIQVALCKNF